MQNRLLTVDFDRRRPISSDLSRGREKEEEGEEEERSQPREEESRRGRRRGEPGFLPVSCDLLHGLPADLSLQSVYIAARSNLSLPTVLSTASNESNTTSSGLSLHTAAALLRNSQTQPTLLLSSSSSTIAATLGCHPSLGDFTTPALTLLSFVAFNLKIAATLFNQFIDRLEILTS
ncbi:hypothetical protein B296_00050229 [Ensete ventricosum]|uniref:Uncharacterized protein n=1 Tax=Ensete ventricosum TaxID=4639 RepID=A0A426Y771_ENSVE|nr:hypothetical protein B296_00050229 [Ensete ventricosum]